MGTREKSPKNLEISLEIDRIELQWNEKERKKRNDIKLLDFDYLDK